jgi:BMFP domain-containing protein YqiC
VANNNSDDRNYDQELSDYRSLQQEMTAIGREASQARLADWSREMEDMAAAWSGFQQDWQGTLEQMAGNALAKFDEIAAQGTAAGNRLAQSWRQALAEVTTEVDALGAHLMETMDQAGQSLQLTSAGGSTNSGSTGDLLSWVSTGLGLGGIFHEGGILEAHSGLAVSPESLLADERLVKVQTGEGILPREAMVQLGEENFEALRSGRFQVNKGDSSPRYDITIQVQSLDAAGVAGMNWEKVVQRHLLPALDRELSRRW